MKEVGSLVYPETNVLSFGDLGENITLERARAFLSMEWSEIKPQHNLDKAAWINYDGIIIVFRSMEVK